VKFFVCKKGVSATDPVERPILIFDPSLLVFKEKAHKYYYDGEHVPGVTTILNVVGKGDALLQWAANCAVEYLKQRLEGDLTTDDVARFCKEAQKQWRSVKEEAGSIGSIAHDWIEQHLKGGNAPLPDHPKARNSCCIALEWMDSVEWETLEVEKVIFHPEYRYAGKYDWKARINRVKAIPDWKTSKDIYSTYRYQTAAYVKAEEAMTGETIPDRWICRIDKEGDFDPANDVLYMPPESLEADFEAFLGALKIYRRESEIRRMVNV
jgi:hypothetical protein